MILLSLNGERGQRMVREISADAEFAYAVSKLWDESLMGTEEREHAFDTAIAALKILRPDGGWYDWCYFAYSVKDGELCLKLAEETQNGESND